MNAVTIFQFAVATLLPVLACLVLTMLHRHTKLSRISDRGWQVIVGIVFGLIAIYGTEAGIPTEGATMNVRDAAPLVAGLFFSGPAGIIAGLIGGIERWFAVLWGAGEFTQLACSAGTIFAGVYAAMLRKYVFENRRPTWMLALATGIVAEVFHLLLVFVTNLDQATKAFAVVKACSLPMIGCVAISVALSGAVLMLLSADRKLRSGRNAPGIAQVVQNRLLITVFIAFLVTTAFVGILQTNLAKSDAENLLRINIEDVQNEISDASDKNLLSIAQRAGELLPSVSDVTQDDVDNLIKTFDIAEVNVIDSKGIIVASNIPQFVNFDMHSGEQSGEFLALLPGGDQTQMVQDYQPMTYYPDISRKYAAVRIDGGILQIGYDADRFQKDLSSQVDLAVANRHVGQGGAIVAIEQSGIVHGSVELGDPKDAAQLIADIDAGEPGTLIETSYAGNDCLAISENEEGYRIIASLPSSEAYFSRDLSVLVTSLLDVLVFAAIFLAIYFVIKRVVVRNIWQVNGRLGEITQGDLDVLVDVRDSSEFASLSDDINQTVDALKQAIAAESARIDRELAYAHAIQEGALPRTFPPFPHLDQFDLYANMHAAREVGGDFYDFFLVGDDSIGFVVADVSGKGIPAALFMMRAKTELSNLVMAGKSLEEAVGEANRRLCEGNDAEMFVTVWVGLLNFKTGELTYVNAGHNPPLHHHGEQWEWLRGTDGLPLGLFDSIGYKKTQRVLAEGDTLFLYSDGVTEAMNSEEELFGEDRLEQCLQANAQETPQNLVEKLHVVLDEWAKDTEQSDDITMFALRYLSRS